MIKTLCRRAVQREVRSVGKCRDVPKSEVRVRLAHRTGLQLLIVTRLSCNVISLRQLGVPEAAPRFQQSGWRGERAMKSIVKTAVAICCGLVVGGGAVQLLHAQTKPPAFVIAEITVTDEAGYKENFLKP